ncbi:MAG: ATPase [Roseiarcus sp.]|jgi:F-type H+-transporting ATPase subunit b
MTIDWWTLGVQTVNVLILVWLLGRFFWRPVAAMIEQRRAAAQRILAEAEAKRSQAGAALAEIERTRAGFAQEREAIIAAAREAAEQERAARLAEAANEAASLQQGASAAIDSEKQSADKAWAERASRLAVDVAGRLVARLDGPSVRAAFLEGLIENIRSLPDPARQAMAADGLALEAISATPLDPADQQRCRALIGEALGANPQIAFKSDPALIAGLELRGPHLLVSNSWRADLAQILADLTHDDAR